jgi:hypothetical protein
VQLPPVCSAARDAKWCGGALRNAPQVGDDDEPEADLPMPKCHCGKYAFAIGRDAPGLQTAAPKQVRWSWALSPEHRARLCTSVRGILAVAARDNEERANCLRQSIKSTDAYGVPTRVTKSGEQQPWATISFHTVIGRHWLSFLRDLHSSLAVIAVIFCQNDNVASG